MKGAKYWAVFGFFLFLWFCISPYTFFYFYICMSPILFLYWCYNPKDRGLVTQIWPVFIVAGAFISLCLFFKGGFQQAMSFLPFAVHEFWSGVLSFITTAIVMYYTSDLSSKTLKYWDLLQKTQKEYIDNKESEECNKE